MLSERKGFTVATLAAAGIYFLLFVLHYEICAFVENDTVVEIVSDAVYLLVVALTAVSASVFYKLLAQRGARAYLSFLFLMTARLAYQIPYYYIYYITDYYASLEALLLGALMSLIELAVCYGVYVLVGLFAVRLMRAQRENLAVLLASLPLVIYELFLLVWELVLYIISYRGTFFADDIPYFVFGFVYCALLLLSSYFLGVVTLSRGFCKKNSPKGEDI